MLVEIEYNKSAVAINASKEELVNGAYECTEISLDEANKLIRNRKLELLETQRWTGETHDFEGYRIVGFRTREIWGKP